MLFFILFILNIHALSADNFDDWPVEAARVPSIGALNIPATVWRPIQSPMFSVQSTSFQPLLIWPTDRITPAAILEPDISSKLMNSFILVFPSTVTNFVHPMTQSIFGYCRPIPTTVPPLIFPISSPPIFMPIHLIESGTTVVLPPSLISAIVGSEIPIVSAPAPIPDRIVPIERPSVVIRDIWPYSLVPNVPQENVAFIPFARFTGFGASQYPWSSFSSWVCPKVAITNILVGIGASEIVPPTVGTLVNAVPSPQAAAVNISESPPDVRALPLDEVNTSTTRGVNRRPPPAPATASLIITTTPKTPTCPDIGETANVACTKKVNTEKMGLTDWTWLKDATVTGVRINYDCPDGSVAAFRIPQDKYNDLVSKCKAAGYQVPQPEDPPIGANAGSPTFSVGHPFEVANNLTDYHKKGAKYQTWYNYRPSTAVESCIPVDNFAGNEKSKDVVCLHYTPDMGPPLSTPPDVEAVGKWVEYKISTGVLRAFRVSSNFYNRTLDKCKETGAEMAQLEKETDGKKISFPFQVGHMLMPYGSETEKGWEGIKPAARINLLIDKATVCV